MGTYLTEIMLGKELAFLTDTELLSALLKTKKPQIFAESDLRGDGSDWNQEELAILGNIGVAVPVTVFDDANHRNPKVHKTPYKATLLFIPGALLESIKTVIPCDLSAVTTHGAFDYKRYYDLYKRRLLPLFEYVQKQAGTHKKKAIITIPGLGCGVFGGSFKGTLGIQLQQVLLDLLTNHINQFPNISLVYYDPYNECSDYERAIGKTLFRVRPLLRTKKPLSQLAEITEFEEGKEDLSDHELYSVVAWDHVSWPGNDFYIGSRATDDGVKAAATDLMYHMTRVEGVYSELHNRYAPPKQYRNWEDVIKKRSLEFVMI